MSEHITDGTSETQESTAKECSAPEPFRSQLSNGWERFLSEIVEEGFKSGVVNPDAFVRRFPPARIMQAFEDSAERRADFVHGVSHTDRKIALRLGAEASGEVIQIALEEKVATTNDLVKLFLPDERVSRLSQQELWNFCTEWEPWNKQRDDAAYADAQRYTAFMLERALAENLIMPPHVTETLTLDAVLNSLIFPGVLHELLKDAICLGRDGKPFTDDDLIKHVTPQVIVAHMEVAHIWDKLVRPHIAEEHGFIPRPEPPAVMTEPPPEEVQGEPESSVDTPPENDESDWSDVVSSLKGEAEESSGNKGPTDPKAHEASATAADASDDRDEFADDVHDRKTVMLPENVLEQPSVEVADRESSIEVDVSELEEGDEDLLLENEVSENYISDEEFSKAGGASISQTPRERTIIPDESVIRRHVVELLATTDLTLPEQAVEMPIKELFIHLLEELDRDTYKDIGQTQDASTRDLGNILCRELMHRGREPLADQLRDATYTILGVDPDKRSYMPPPRPRSMKDKKKRR